MIKCRLCGRGPNQIRGYLHRVNELGVTGVWECRPSCDADMSAEERIIAAIEGEETDAEHTSNSNMDNERPT